MLELNKEQKNAIQSTIESKFVIINGGAGVGKTTIIKEIHKILKGEKIELCCPTGKASARLREASGLPARTLHSLLIYNGSRFMGGNLKDIILVIDESSMIDSHLMYNIIRREPKKLILIGDEGQLFPVGAGQPFHDFVKFKKIKVCNLLTCYRTKEAVFKCASMVRNLEHPPMIEKSNNEKWEMIDTGKEEKTIELILDLVRKNLINFETDIILSAKNSFVDYANEKILEVISPREEGKKWKVGDRIICCKNFSKVDTWNGTTGTITDIDGSGRAWVKGDIDYNVDGVMESEILWTKEMLKESKHAYALTVHKSQGSQYRNVIFCVFDDAKLMLTNSLIYTAITRTKKNCTILGNPYLFFNSINKKQERETVLQELMK